MRRFVHLPLLATALCSCPRQCQARIAEGWELIFEKRENIYPQLALLLNLCRCLHTPPPPFSPLYSPPFTNDFTADLPSKLPLPDMDELAPRLSLVARNSAAFMRFAARAASLPAFEVTQVADLSTCLQILLIASVALAVIYRRVPSQDSAQKLRRVLVATLFLHIGIDLILMPRVLSLDPLIPKYRTIEFVAASWCYRNCRFRKNDLPRVLNNLRLPDVCHLDNRASVPAETVLICSLFTLAYPRRQDDVAAEFGFANQSLVSRILNYFCTHVVQTFGRLVQQADDDDDGYMIWAPYMALFQDCIYAVSRSDDFRDVAMFTDGTFRPACRPLLRQEDADRDLSTQQRVYSGLRAR